MKMTSDGLFGTYQAINVDLTKLKVYLHVYERTNKDTYLFKGSYDSIARETGVSYSAVADAMITAIETGLFTPVSRGVWHVEGNVFEGNDDEPYILIRHYCDT